MDIMEIEVKRSWMGGKNTWKQYAFQLIDSNLKYFSKIDKVKRIHCVYYNIIARWIV